MPETEDINSQKGDGKKVGKLGISPFTYGLGVSAKYHWVLRGISIILPIGLLAVFRNDNQKYNRDWLVAQFTKPEAWLRDKFKQFTHSTDNPGDPFKGLLTLIVASGFMVSMINRIFVEVPAILQGKKLAQQAESKYNAALAENEQLKTRLTAYEKTSPEASQNTQAQEQASRDGASSRIAPRPASFAEAAMQRDTSPPASGLSS